MSSSEKVINFTPALAREWLPRVHTRAVVPSHVETLRQICMRGEWRLSVVPICVRKDGTVGGGMHRLSAFALCPDGMTFPCRVLYGCTDEEISAGDIGRPWSNAALLGEGQKITEVARTMAHIYLGAGVGISAAYLRPFVEYLRTTHAELLAYAPHCCRLITAAPMRLATCLAILDGGDKQYILSTYRALSLKDYAALSPIAGSFLRQAEGMKLSRDQLGSLLTRAHRMYDVRNAQTRALIVKDQSDGIEWVKTLVRKHVRPTAPNEGAPFKAEPRARTGGPLRQQHQGGLL